MCTPCVQVKGQDVPPPLKEWTDAVPQQKQKQQQQKQQKQKQQQQQQQPHKRKHNGHAPEATTASVDATAALLLAQPAPLTPSLLDRLRQQGWDTPTPVQRQAVPALLAARDVLAVAPTGSGKTLAFLLPMVALLTRAKQCGGAAWPAAPKALLLSPTRELAVQTARVLRLLLPGSGLRCCLLSPGTAGGADFSTDVDVLVANPLRLKVLLEAGRLDLSQVCGLWW
jgi:superfamily II DNA/RNA helicase